MKLQAVVLFEDLERGGEIRLHMLGTNREAYREERKGNKRKIHQYRCIQITLVPEFCNAAHSCSQRGLATAWLTSECPRNFIPIPKSCTVMETHCLSQCNDGSITKRLGQPIKQGILSTKAQFAPFLHEFTYSFYAEYAVRRRLKIEEM